MGTPSRNGSIQSRGEIQLTSHPSKFGVEVCYPPTCLPACLPAYMVHNMAHGICMSAARSYAFACQCLVADDDTGHRAKSDEGERNKERFGDVEKDYAGRARRGCSARRRSLSGSDFPVLGSLKVDIIITVLIIAIIIGFGIGRGRGRGSSTSGAPPCPPCEAILVPQEGNGRRLRHRGVRGGRARVGGSSQARKVCQDSRWDFESPHPSL